MRDLYDSEKKLLYWIKRAESDLEEPDRTDVLKLVKHLQDQRSSKYLDYTLYYRPYYDEKTDNKII